MKDQNLFGPIHATLPSHRKTERLVRRLAISRAAVVGGLVCLWCRVMLEAPDGCLEGWSDDDIASAFDWAGDPATLRQALIATGWLDDRDGVLHCHEWGEYYGAKLTRRARDTVRKREARAAERAGRDALSAGQSEMSTNVQRTKSDTLDFRSETETETEKKRESEGGADTQPKHPNPLTHPWPNRPKKNRGVIGLEEQTRKPKDPKSFAHGLAGRLRIDFPAYDGRNGRPDLETKLVALWSAYSRAYDADGPTVADAKLRTWLGDDYGKHRAGYERDGYGTAVEPPKRPPPVDDEPPPDEFWDNLAKKRGAK